MGVSLIFLGVRQQNGCFDTHTFIQFSTYGAVRAGLGLPGQGRPVSLSGAETEALTSPRQMHQQDRHDGSPNQGCARLRFFGLARL